MKKMLCSLLTVLLLVSCFAGTVNAAERAMGKFDVTVKAGELKPAKTGFRCPKKMPRGMKRSLRIFQRKSIIRGRQQTFWKQSAAHFGLENGPQQKQLRRFKSVWSCISQRMRHNRKRNISG